MATAQVLKGGRAAPKGQGKGRLVTGAKGKARSKGLPAAGRCLARLPLVDLLGGKETRTIEGGGYRLLLNRDRVSLQPLPHGGVRFGKTCDAVELWATPIVAGDPAAFLQIRFARDGEPVRLYVGVSLEHRNWWLVSEQVDSSRSGYAQMHAEIPSGFGEALLALFPNVPEAVNGKAPSGMMILTNVVNHTYRGFIMAMLARAVPINPEDLPEPVKAELARLYSLTCQDPDPGEALQVAWACRLDTKPGPLFIAGPGLLDCDGRIIFDGPANLRDLEGWMTAIETDVPAAGAHGKTRKGAANAA